MHMIRIADNADWNTYISNCNLIRNESAEYATLVGFRNGSTVIPSAYSQENVITFSETDANGKINKRKVSFAYTDKGIRLYAPTTVNGITCDEFIWNNADKSFISTEDANIQLKYVQPTDYIPIEFYTEHQWDLSYTYNFGRKDTTETVTFSRVGQSDTLQTKVTCGGLQIKLNALYNHITGMIEFRTQYLTEVVLT